MNTVQNISGYLTPYDFEMITIDDTVGGKGFTVSKLSPGTTAGEKSLGKARMVLVQVLGQSIRYRFDGGAPVATSSGYVAAATDPITFSNFQAMSNFRAIREGGSNATLAVTYLR